MNTDTIRRAAALMRERVKACDPGGDWYEQTELLDAEIYSVDAEYIATTPPRVLLAVAKWLEHEADVADKLWAPTDPTGGPTSPPQTVLYIGPAMEVALTYLGEGGDDRG